MLSYVEVRAGFVNLNIKSGKTVLQFELDAKSVRDIPLLAGLTGMPVRLDISTDQEALFIHDEMGEIGGEPLFDAPDEGDVEAPDAEEAEGEAGDEA